MPRQTNLLPDDDLEKPYSLNVEPQEDGFLKLDWETIGYQCEGYKVYRSSTEEGTFELIATTTSPYTTLYEDANVVVGQTYYYKVAAYEGGRESERSNTGSAKMVSLVVPEPPANVVATVSAGGSSVYVTWDPGENADIYEIERRTEGGIFREVTSTRDTATGDNRVTYGRSYFYRVRSVSETGETSSWAETEEAAVMVDTVPPSQPTGVTLVANQDSIELFWQPPTDDDLAGFNIYRAREGNNEYNAVTSIGDPSAQSWEDTTVNRGETWRYRISAVDREGNESPRTVSFAGTPTNQAPLKPVLDVSLDADQLPVVGYDITGAFPNDVSAVVVQRRTQDGTWTQVAEIDASSPGSFADSTADVNVTYEYRAKYRDEGGLESEWSDVVSVFTSNAEPGQPTSLAAGYDQYAWADLSWMDPADQPVSYVAVQRSTNPSGGFTEVAQVNAGEQSYYDTSTNAQVTYYYRIAGVNSKGDYSAWTDVVSVIPQDNVAPSTPSNLSATKKEYPSPEWSIEKGLPVPSYGHSSVTKDDGKVLIFGGRNGNTEEVFDTVYEYDPATGLYSNKASMPNTSFYAGVTKQGKKVHIMGGYRNGHGASQTTDDHWIYDIEQDKWTDHGTVHGSYAGMSATTFGSIVYVLGGWNENNTSIVEAYDPVSDSWTRKSPLPVGMNTHKAVSYDGSIYVFGGQLISSSVSSSKDVYKYDIATDTWELVATLPQGVEAISVAQYEEKVYITTIASNSAAKPDMYEFNLLDNTVKEVLPLSYPRKNGSAVVADHRLYVFGGRDSSSTFSEVESTDLVNILEPHVSELSWDGNEENDFSGYNIYRLNPGETEYSKIAETGTNHYTDRDIGDAGEYGYAVSSFDERLNESAMSTGTSVLHN